MRPEPASIRDVARRAGVSVTTVSHALSGRRPVRPETARRVREVVAELGYVPSSTGRSLQSGRTAVLGLIVPDISNEFFGKLAKGVEDTANGNEHAVMLCNTDFDAAREDRYLELMCSRYVDGLIYAAGSTPTTRRLGSLVSSIPVVLADEYVEDLPGALLTTADHRQGGRLAGSHLRELGHADALVISGPRGLRSADDRAAGFREHLPAASVVAGDFTEATGMRATAAALASGIAFTAVFAANDLAAIGAISALNGAGLRVPQDVSVVGFDDIGLASWTRPALTTVRQPAYEIGATAAAGLLERLADDGPRHGVETVLPVELVIRESTGPVPTPRSGGKS